MESYTCAMCNRRIPLANETIHSARCRGNSHGNNPLPNAQLPVSIPGNERLPEPDTDCKWTCLTCTYNNDMSNGVCDMCGAAPGEENVPDTFDQCSPSFTNATQNCGTWSCTSCTYLNNATHSSCLMCQQPRPADPAYRDQLIPDLTPAARSVSLESSFPTAQHYDPEASSSQFAYSNARPSRSSGMSGSSSSSASGQPSSLAASMALGAGLGAGLAWLHDADVSQGALTGAGIGAVGDLMLREMAEQAEQRRRSRQPQLSEFYQMQQLQQQQEQQRRFTGGSRNSHSSSGRQTSVTSSSSGYPAPLAQPVFDPWYGAYGLDHDHDVRMDSSSSDDDSGFGEGEGEGSFEAYDPPAGAARAPSAAAAAGPMDLFMREVLGASFGTSLERRRMLQVQQQQIRGQMQPQPQTQRQQQQQARYGVGGGVNINIDRLPYQALLDMFPQPDRGVSEDTLSALPVRSYTAAAPAAAAPAATGASTSAPTAIGSGDSNASSSCSICMEEYAQGDSVKTLPCLHCFHAQCVDHWLRQRQTCPICKHSISC